MKMRENLKTNLVSIQRDTYALYKLRVKYFFGKFSNSKENYLIHLAELWYLSYDQTDDENLFRDYLSDRINHIEKKLVWYNILRKKMLKYIIYSIVFPLILFLIIQNNDVRLILGAFIYTLMLILYILLVIVTSYKPSEKKVSITLAFLYLLKKYYSSSKPMDILNKNKVIKESSKLVLPFTSAELAAVFGRMFRNTDIEGVKNKDIADYIELYCCQQDGSSFNNMSVMISTYGDLSTSEAAFNSFINKLNQSKQ